MVYTLTKLGYIDGKCHHDHSIHTDPMGYTHSTFYDAGGSSSAPAGPFSIRCERNEVAHCGKPSIPWLMAMDHEC